jgi:glycerol uptake facilitator-like aquaporin
VAAAIWIFIKLPQEWWIHIAELDTTDLIREYPIGAVIVAIVGMILLYVGYRVVKPKLPPPDWSWRIDADADEPDLTPQQVQSAKNTMMSRLWTEQLLEKFVMLSLVCGIFGLVLPDVDASNLDIAIGVVLVLIVNTVVSEFLARRGVDWKSVFTQFVAMAAINAGIAVAFFYLLRSSDDSINLGSTLFFLLLITLIITLYDRYRPFSLARFGEEQSLSKGI